MYKNIQSNSQINKKKITQLSKDNSKGIPKGIAEAAFGRTNINTNNKKKGITIGISIKLPRNSQLRYKRNS